MNEQKREAERIFTGVKFAVDRVTITTHAGEHVKRELVVHPGAVIVLPLLDDGRVVMFRNQRFAVGQELWELPAGTLEDDEPAMDCARRELIEETGYRAEKVVALSRFYTSPGFTNEDMHAFVATDLTHVGQQLEATEKIEVEILPMDEVLAMIRDGRIVDGKTIATLLHYHAFGRPGS
jgi:ADP-ribose pyrophosphatase